MRGVGLYVYLTVGIFSTPVTGGSEGNQTASANTTMAFLTSDNVTSGDVNTLAGCDDFTTDNKTSCLEVSTQTETDGSETTSNDTSVCNGTEANGDEGAHCGKGPETLKSASTVTTVIKYVGYITVPFFLALSLSGNSLTLIVMFSKQFWNSPCSVLLIALALSDSIYSIVFPFSKLFVRDLIGYDPRALSEVGCHIFFIVHKSSKMCSSWFIVAICIERFIAVWFPLKAKIICSKRNTMAVVLVITIGMLIFTGLWTFSTKIVNGICVPNYATPENALLARAYLVAGSLVFSVIPAAVLVILTPAICIKIHYQSKLRRSLSNKLHESNVEASRANAMLLGVTIAYIVLVTPTAVAHNVCFTLNINFYESKLLSMSIARATLQVMEQLNFSINFLLYVMCNRSFRNRVMAVLQCQRRKMGSRSNSFYSNRTQEMSKY